jgi:hypothetical protein
MEQQPGRQRVKKQPRSSEEFHMDFEDIKDAIMDMDANDQKRLIMEVIPLVWESACDDPSCAVKLKQLVDSGIMRPYDDLYMGGI